MRSARGAKDLVLDLSGVTELDGAGAVLVLHAAELSPGARFDGAQDSIAETLERTRRALGTAPMPAPPNSAPWW